MHASPAFIITPPSIRHTAQHRKRPPSAMQQAGRNMGRQRELHQRSHPPPTTAKPHPSNSQLPTGSVPREVLERCVNLKGECLALPLLPRASLRFLCFLFCLRMLNPKPLQKETRALYSTIAGTRRCRLLLPPLSPTSPKTAIVWDAVRQN